MLEANVADPALSGVSVTVSEVRMSPDLRHATCFVNPLGGVNADEVVAGLNRATRFFRGRLGPHVELRFTPDLVFRHDESFETAAKMDALFDRLNVQRDTGVATPIDAEDESEGRRRLMGRRKSGDPVSGWVCLDKPLGLGSTGAVGKVRALLKAQKAGHAGTLDPLASGILPIALGEATKTMPFATDASKSYRFTVEWGRATTTLDLEGETSATSDVRPTPEAAAEALKAFVGEISQVPPAFSAIKVDGERSYDLAREGRAVELAPRTVTIHAARVSAAPDADHLEVEIDCGKGVYVRSLARDLAAALGTVGHVCALRRTRVGPFTEANAISLESFAESGA